MGGRRENSPGPSVQEGVACGAALQATRAFRGPPGPRPAYRNRALVREATARSLLARRADGGSAWAALARDTASDPDLLADMVAACVRHRLQLPGIGRGHV